MVTVRTPEQGDRRYVVVGGPPGSGKTTLAIALAAELGLPLIAKDTIKEALMSILPVPDVETSRTVGRASVAVLLAVAAESGSAVLESAWHRSRAAGDLARLPGHVVEVFCRCDHNTARRRYRERSHTRQAGHFDAERLDSELSNDEVARPVAAGWPVIEVDTTTTVDLADVVRRIGLAFRSSGAPQPR